MEIIIPVSMRYTVLRYREDLIRRIEAGQSMTKWGLIESPECAALKVELRQHKVDCLVAQKTNDWGFVLEMIGAGPQPSIEHRMARSLSKLPESDFDDLF